MREARWSEILWGEKATFTFLLMAAAILLMSLLGGREIWTQEHRWADIVSGMFYRHDFLHPVLGEADYYDKPLLSYWLIAGIAYFSQDLSTWALRLPSALAGLLAIGSIYRIGLNLKNKSLGLLAGWLLLTTFYFIFWARTSSADMLNMAGALFAVCWYVEKKSSPTLFNYSVFFIILALACLCKGLVAAVVTLLVILPDCVVQKNRPFRLTMLIAMVPAMMLYLLPFWASSHFGNQAYSENGLYEVYRENVLRYFQPFDHKGPIYTYFIFLPIYLLPWAIFLIPAVFSLKKRWNTLPWNAKWMVWAVILLFLFFTLSGSRRNYYVLPIVPFAILVIAEWILANKEIWQKWAGRLTIVFFIVLFINFDLLQPLYYSRDGIKDFTITLKNEANKVKPWDQWHIVMLDPESKIRFYLQLPPDVKMLHVNGERSQQTQQSLLQTWPILQKQPGDVIFVSRKQYEPLLKNILSHYQLVEGKKNNSNTPIAFIPAK